MTAKLSKFEMSLMNTLLEGDDNVLSLLRNQFSNSKVQSKIKTDAGFYITFIISEQAEHISDEDPSTKSNFCFGDVDATVSGLSNGAGFLIWVKNGFLNQVEGYTYGEKWPLEVENYVLSYRDGNRNIKALRKEWLK